MSNKVYDVLKWVAQLVLPACAVLYATLGATWGLPYTDEIATTIMAFDTFLGAILGISSVQYAKKNATSVEQKVEG